MHDRNVCTVLYPGRKYVLFLQNKICIIIAMTLKVDITCHFISHTTSVLLPYHTLLLCITSGPHIKRNKDSVVSVVTIRAGWRTYKSWFDSRQGQQGSSLLQHVQIGCETYPTFSSVSTASYFSGHVADIS
jgi:hypothetical protein